MRISIKIIRMTFFHTASGRTAYTDCSNLID